MRNARFFSAVTVLSLTAAVAARAGTARISVDASQTGSRIPKSLYSVFLEEINYAGAVGLYAELIRNRGFENANLPLSCSLENGFQRSAANTQILQHGQQWNVTSTSPDWSLRTAAGVVATSPRILSSSLVSKHDNFWDFRGLIADTPR